MSDTYKNGIYDAIADLKAGAPVLAVVKKASRGVSLDDAWLKAMDTQAAVIRSIPGLEQATKYIDKHFTMGHQIAGFLAEHAPTPIASAAVKSCRGEMGQLSPNACIATIDSAKAAQGIN